MIRKFIVALVGAIALAVAYVATDETITTVEWVQVVIAVASAAQVWLTANVPSLGWAKTLTAVVLGVANVLVGAIIDGITLSDVMTMIVAGMTAAGVYMVPNRPPAGAAYPPAART